MISLLALGCKKNEENPNYVVKYLITGTSVNEFKFNDGNSVSHSMKTPFTGSKDTTIIYTKVGVALSLQGKADAPTKASLVGKIYVNGVEVATQTDADTDSDGKTQIKIDYTLK
jgi:hypothetical protein